MNKLSDALDFAKEKHGKQLYGNKPYINHLYETVDIAIKSGCSSKILVACALHDTIEDTTATKKEISKLFGEEIAEIVDCVSDSEEGTRREKKIKVYAKIKGNNDALTVKLCDRIANVKSSIKNNKKKLKMYQLEHQSFCDSLYDIQHPSIIQDLFNILIDLIHYKKTND
jgi:(p)ppGpp synthase/HD superfamily hydrolase